MQRGEIQLVFDLSNEPAELEPPSTFSLLLASEIRVKAGVEADQRKIQMPAKSFATFEARQDGAADSKDIDL